MHLLSFPSYVINAQTSVTLQIEALELLQLRGIVLSDSSCHDLKLDLLRVGDGRRYQLVADCTFRNVLAGLREGGAHSRPIAWLDARPIVQCHQMISMRVTNPTNEQRQLRDVTLLCATQSDAAPAVFP